MTRPLVLLIEADPSASTKLQALIRGAGRRPLAVSEPSAGRAHLSEDALGLVVVCAERPDDEAIALLQTLRDERPEVGRLLICPPAVASELDLTLAKFLPLPLSPRDFALSLAAPRPPPPTAAPDTDPVSARLAKLKALYRETLGPKLDHLSGLLQTLEAQLAADTLDEARRLAHTLKGTAGTYGFSGVSEAAGEVEALLETLVAEEAREAPPLGGAIDSISRAREALS